MKDFMVELSWLLASGVLGAFAFGFLAAAVIELKSRPFRKLAQDLDRLEGEIENLTARRDAIHRECARLIQHAERICKEAGVE